MSIFEFANKRPEIDETAWLAPDAMVMGKVQLGANASLWFGAVLRGDNELIKVGQGSNIQELSLCHTDMGYPLTIGINCTIGHKAILHGCIIGNYSLIGMGATVLNGAKIGSYCLIGAGALVAEGCEIPDGSLVIGMPARIRRILSLEERQKLEDSAVSYQIKAKEFQKKLREIKNGF